jgi:hypothetical protein
MVLQGIFGTRSIPFSRKKEVPTVRTELSLSLFLSNICAVCVESFSALLCGTGYKLSIVLHILLYCACLVFR